MTFGDINYLPTTPSRWVGTNAIITATTAELNDGGSIFIRLTADDIVSVPDVVMLEFRTLTPVTGYLYLRCTHKATDELEYRYLANLISDGSGVYSAVFFFDTSQFDYLDFALYCTNAVTVTSLKLLLPIADEARKMTADGIMRELQKILFDYNCIPITFAQEEKVVALAHLVLYEETELQGHFEICFTATNYARCIIRIKASGEQELLSPLKFEVSPGVNTIGIPHAYIALRAGTHTLAITAQLTAGTATVPTRGILYTVDGGYIYKRCIKAGTNVDSLGIQQLASDANPSRLYAAMRETSSAFVSSRAYNESADQPWNTDFTIANYATQSGLAFDGTWIMRENKATFITEDSPWVFWLDLPGSLRARYGSEVEPTEEVPDPDSSIELATGTVTNFDACKGYCSAAIPQHDHGVVVVYIKAGKVYYRTYAKQTDGVKIWEVERQITLFGLLNKHISICLLNSDQLVITATKSNGMSQAAVTNAITWRT